MEINFKPIGVVHSCFKEKFGIPRQPRIVEDARAMVEILPPFDQDEAFKALDGFSHVWIVFVFHQNIGVKWSPTVRPPRLGGNKRVGVFASRSPVRPNPIGMSAVELEKIERTAKKLMLHLKGIDFLDQTPVLDIKPYVPYSDAVQSATGGFAPGLPASRLSVEFSEIAREKTDRINLQIPWFSKLVSQVIEADPRPAYYGDGKKEKVFGMRLYDYNIKWVVEKDSVRVLDIEDDGSCLAPSSPG